MTRKQGAAQTASYSSDDLLKYAVENGILDLPNIKEQINMNERKKYLEKHTNNIWQGSDGKYYTYLPDETKPKKRVLCKRKTREEIEDAIIAFWKEREENPTVEEVFKEWNNRKLERGQIKHVTHTINEDTFNRFYKDFGKRKIKCITPMDWEEFLCDCIYKNKLTHKCFANLKGLTKGFLKRAKKRGLINMEVEHFFLELDVSDSDFKRKMIDEEKEIFFDDEVDKIMAYIRNNLDLKNLGIALMFVTGLRVGELVTLKHSDFDGTIFQVKRTQTRYREKKGKYVVTVSDIPKTPAGYRTVIVPNSQRWIVDKLKLCNPFDEYIFLNDKKELMNTDMIRKRLYLICDKVGVPRKSPHKIRKTYGSILLDNGLDNKLIEGQMGHTDITCTERFYHRNRRKLNEKQAIIDNIPEFMAR